MRTKHFLIIAFTLALVTACGDLTEVSNPAEDTHSDSSPTDRLIILDQTALESIYDAYENSLMENACAGTIPLPDGGRIEGSPASWPASIQLKLEIPDQYPDETEDNVYCSIDAPAVSNPLNLVSNYTIFELSMLDANLSEPAVFYFQMHPGTTIPPGTNRISLFTLKRELNPDLSYAFIPSAPQEAEIVSITLGGDLLLKYVDNQGLFSGPETLGDPEPIIVPVIPGMIGF